MRASKITVGEAADYLEMSLASVWRRIGAGEIDVEYVGPRQPRIDSRKLAKYRDELWRQGWRPRRRRAC